MSEPRSQHPGLAGAGAGQHQNRPVDGFDGGTLAVVEYVQIGRIGVRSRPGIGALGGTFRKLERI